MNMTPVKIQTRLQTYYRRTFPEGNEAQILDVNPLTEGWESIIYAYKVQMDPKSEEPPQNRILRIYPGTDAYQKSQREFEGLRVLHQLGYPVPQVYHLECEQSPFEKPFLLMEQIEGEMMWHVLGQVSSEQRAALIAQFTELLLRLHRLDWQPFVPEATHHSFSDPYHCVDQFMGGLQDAISAFPRLDVFQGVVEWLEAHRDEVPCLQPAPVHWDFHPGNVMISPGRGAVVIDWTQIQVSDPRFDLGWTLLLISAYEGIELRSRILAEYQRLSGMPVEGLAFFDVANALKRLGSVMISLSAGADQMGMRPDAVAQMHQDFPALQRVYDLMVSHTHIRIPQVEELLNG